MNAKRGITQTSLRAWFGEEKREGIPNREKRVSTNKSSIGKKGRSVFFVVLTGVVLALFLAFNATSENETLNNYTEATLSNLTPTFETNQDVNTTEINTTDTTLTDLNLTDESLATPNDSITLTNLTPTFETNQDVNITDINTTDTTITDLNITNEVNATELSIINETIILPNESEATLTNLTPTFEATQDINLTDLNITEESQATPNDSITLTNLTPTFETNQELNLTSDSMQIDSKFEISTSDLSSLNGSEANLTLINIQADNSQLGTSVAVGDVDGDGIQDIIGGADAANGASTSSGRVYVWLGTNQSNLASVNGSEPNLTLENLQPDDSFLGGSVAAGDIDGDGIQDIISGANLADNTVEGVNYTTAGRVYVWLGTNTTNIASVNGTEPNLTLENLQPDNSNLGDSVAAGDINKDGIQDVIGGASAADGGIAGASGRVYAWLGTNQANIASLNGTEPNLTLINIQLSDGSGYLGVSVAAGDIDADGITDIISGASAATKGAYTNSGRVYAWTAGDTTPPIVTIEAPDNDTTNTTTHTIDFTYNITDDGTLNNCSLIIQNGDDINVNVTDTSALKDTIGQNLTTELTNGEYNWTVNCTDISGNEGTAEWRNISIDYRDPGICDQGDIATSCNITTVKVYTTNQEFNFTEVYIKTGGTIIVNSQANLTLNASILIIENTAVVTAQVVNITAENLTIELGGTVNASGTGNKGAGVDGADGSGEGAGRGYPTGNNKGAGGGGYGGDGGTGGGTGAGGGGNVSGSTWQPLDMGSGGGCGDASTTTRGGEGGGLIVLEISDTINITGEVLATGTNYSWASTEGCGGGSGGGVYINTTSYIQTGNIDAGGSPGNAEGGTSNGGSGGGGGGGRIAVYYTTNTTEVNATALGGPGGQGAQGPNGIAGKDGTVYITDSTPPNVTLVLPLHNSQVTMDSEVNFTYTIIDDADAINCTLNINGEANQSNQSAVLMNQDNNISINLNNGSYNWSVICDNGAFQTTSDIWTVSSIDTASPVITIESPDDNTTNTTTNAIEFVYNVTEDILIDNCSLIVQNGEDINVNVTDIAMLQNTPGQNLTTYLDNGEYNWTINCTDSSNNEGTAEWRNISIQAIPPGMEFADPTPPDNTNTTNLSAEINITITQESIGSFVWNWNGTEYNFYNDTLLIGFSFDNNSNMGDNGTSSTDLSIYSQNISAGGPSNPWEPELDPNGKYSGGLSFNGSQFVITDLQIPKDSLNQSGVTFEAWIKTNGTGEEGILCQPRDSGNPYCATFGLLLTTQDTISTVSGDGLSEYNFAAGTTNVSDNTWHHIVGTYNPTTQNITTYVDGSQENESYMNGLIQADVTDYFVIGRTTAAGNRYFKGTIDEVRVYNRSLTADEIQQHYYSYLYKYDTNKWSFYTNQSGLQTGIYTYSGTAQDKWGNPNSTETRTLQVTTDTVPPTITIEAPPDNTTNQTTNTIDFTYNVTDTLSPLDNCTLIIQNGDDININITDTEIIGNTPGQNFTVYLNNAEYNWTINCTDNLNNIGTSEWRNLTIKPRNIHSIINGTTPSLTFENLQPDNSDLGTSVTTGDIDGDGINDIIAGAINADNGAYTTAGRIYVWLGTSNTNIASLNGSEPNLTLENLQQNNSQLGNSVTTGDIDGDGINDIIAGANQADNGAYTSAGRIYAWTTGDTTPPTVTIESPDDNTTNTTTNTIDFTYNVTDDLSNIDNCSLIIQNQDDISINLTDTTMTKDAAGQNLTIYLDNSEYNWTINCTDTYNNQGTAEWRNISIQTICDQGDTATECNITTVKTFITNQDLNFNILNILTGGSIIINSGANLTINATTILMQNTAIITAQVMNITAENLTIELGGTLNTTGTGHLGARTSNGNGTGPGGGGVVMGDYSGGGGGGYGGRGGAGGNWSSYVGGDGGTTYGSITEPVDLGSGGGTGVASGGDGGGLIFLELSGTLNITGSIMAEGSMGNISGFSGTGGAGGGGSGGSVYINTTTITQTGTITANGGDGQNNGSSSGGGGGGGGGGRIRITYQTNQTEITTTINTGQLGNGSGVEIGTGQNGTEGYNGTNYITDTNTPNITIILPQNSTTAYIGEVNFTFLVTNDIDIYNCTLTINDQENQTNQTNINLNQDHNISINLTLGTYNWTITCDEERQTGTNDDYYTATTSLYELTVTDTTPPTVTIESPDDNTTNTTTNTIDFTYNTSDTSNLDNCTLIINDEINTTDTSMLKYTTGQNFTIYLDNSDYNWSINCTDTSNNIGNTETRNISIKHDTTPPTLTIEAPPDNTTNQTANTIDFTYNVTDTLSPLDNCTLIIQNDDDININITDTAMIQSTAGQNFTAYLDNAEYNWTINCTDNLNNIGTSDWRNLTIKPRNIHSIINGTTPSLTFENLQPDNSQLGQSVTTGDIDADGITDIISGAYQADNGVAPTAGRVYVWLGTGNTNIASLNGTEPNLTLENLQIDNSYLGWSVATGDIDGDGITDIISGAYQADKGGSTRAGRVYVWLGTNQANIQRLNGTEPNLTLENIQQDNSQL